MIGYMAEAEDIFREAHVSVYRSYDSGHSGLFGVQLQHARNYWSLRTPLA